MLKAGDVVMARMKNFPPWPAKIVPVSEAPTNAVRASGSIMVYFFGSRNYGHLKKKHVTPFRANAPHSKSMALAFEEACYALSNADNRGDNGVLTNPHTTVMSAQTDQPSTSMRGQPPFSAQRSPPKPSVPSECRDVGYEPLTSSEESDDESEKSTPCGTKDNAPDGAVQHQGPEATEEQDTSGSEAAVEKPQRKRRKIADPSAWKRNIAKKHRRLGEAYVDQDGSERTAKAMKTVDCSTCRFRCEDNFSEPARQAIFDSYYILGDFNRQKDFILHRIKTTEVARRRTGAKTPKSVSVQHYFSTEDGEEIRVCRKFFIATLAISINSVSIALKGIGGQGEYAGTDNRGKQEPKNKTSVKATAFVHSHISRFPTMAPHYVRRDSLKSYLQPGLNLRKMFRLYEPWCEEVVGEASRVKPEFRVSEFIYRQIFHRDFDLGFFQPRKDQCATCVRKSLLEGEALQAYLRDVHEPHVQRKNEAMTEKQRDKDTAKADATYRSINFDLQAVLNTPCSAVGTLYYKRKLCVYNLTIYEQVSHRGLCYLWNETIGKRGSNEIGSCLLKYLETLPSTVLRISMYSDTCSGQNRNINVAAMLLHTVANSQSLEIIDQKFLESGHSYMEADSIHAAIEYSRRNAVESVQDNAQTVVRIPQDWETVIATARQKKGSDPYHVTSLDQTDIKDLKKLTSHIIRNKNKNTDGNKVNWLTTKWFQYRKSAPTSIFYKENYSDAEFKRIDVCVDSGRRSVVRATDATLQNAYTQLLPISTAKYTDLLSLVSGPNLVVDPFYESYYRNLPHSAQVVDTLPEPTEDDDQITQ